MVGVYAWFFNSEGIEGAKLTVSGTLIIAIANIILNVILIPQIGLYGAIGATTLAFSLGLGYNFYRGKRFSPVTQRVNDRIHNNAGKSVYALPSLQL